MIIEVPCERCGHPNLHLELYARGEAGPPSLPMFAEVMSDKTTNRLLYQTSGGRFGALILADDQAAAFFELEPRSTESVEWLPGGVTDVLSSICSACGDELDT